MSCTETTTTKEQSKERVDDSEFLRRMQKVDNTCHFSTCKKSLSNFAIRCKYCNNGYCTSHGLPEIHGCGEAVRRDEKRQFLHPKPTVSQDEHKKAANKLGAKLKQMQFERKAKQGSSKGKK